MANYILSELRYPGATSTSVGGINDAGQIVGSYTTAAGTNGFIYTNGVYTPVSVPGASSTALVDINDVGQFIGNYTDASGTHGFLNTAGLFSTIIRPGNLSTSVTGLNDAGQITLDDAIYSGGTFTPIPTSVYYVPHAQAINDRGDVVGFYTTPVWPMPYIQTVNTPTRPFTAPGATLGVYAADINNLGEIVGFYAPRLIGNVTGIISDREGLSYFSYPGARDTRLYGVNDDRTIIGAFVDGSGTHAFVGTVSTHLNPVYRFYNVATQDHFFTASGAEKDAILKTQPAYLYEGVAFATPDKGTATSDVFRFYDTADGSHFYTASIAERDAVLRTQPGFVYEGVAFQAYAIPREAGSGAAVLERFYNASTGQHHYTAGAAEIQALGQGVAATGWTSEGPAFTAHVPTEAMLLL